MREDPDELTKCAENFRVLTKFGYSRQCIKCIQNFQDFEVSDCQYLNFGYYDISLFLFSKVKKQSRGIRFNDDNEIFTALEQAIDTLKKEDLLRLIYSNALMLKDSTLKK